MSNGRDTNVSIWYMFRGGRFLALLRLLFNCIPAIMMLVVEDTQLYESFLTMLCTYIIMYIPILLLFCGINFLLHKKIAVLCEEEIIIFPDIHIAYDEITCIEYMPAQPPANASNLGQVSSLYIYKRTKRYTVERAPEGLFYALKKKGNGNMEAKRSKEMLYFNLVMWGIAGAIYIWRILF